uniref:DYW domain-containing protein n=1 Tax=Arcella intermedia TaxID=1963864 RepID=A0A6B2L7P2_9EUKA
MWLILISICGKNNNLLHLQNVHKNLLNSSQLLSTFLYNSLIQNYSKCSDFETSFSLFSEMPSNMKDATTYSIMIGICGDFRMIDKAKNLFDEMIEKNIAVDKFVIGAMLHALCHSILPDEALSLFNRMEDEFKIKPSEHHHSIVIDALGRVGRLDEAEKICELYPSQCAWTSLLGSCRLFLDEERAERIFWGVFQKDYPSFVPSYIIMANIHAMLGHWDKQQQVWKLKSENKLKKIPGKSWIFVNGKMHYFVAHETQHFALASIRSFHKTVVDKIKVLGYKADVSWVSKNISEDDKELDLCEHSERYALCYGMMEVQEGPISIFKNLRVCGDCHTYAAMVSKAFLREIRLRDSVTWHIFKDGKCSCNGKW